MKMKLKILLWIIIVKYLLVGFLLLFFGSSVKKFFSNFFL